MRHEERIKLRVTAGFAKDLNATVPEQTMSFPVFNFQGDRNPLQDPDNPEDPARFEFGLDITPFLSSLDPGVPVTVSTQAWVKEGQNFGEASAAGRKSPALGGA